MTRRIILVAAGLLVASGPATAGAVDQPGPSATAAVPEVANVVLLHDTDPHAAPYTVVFATRTPLERRRDDENISRYPGDVLVNGGRRLHLAGGGTSPDDVPEGHRQGPGRHCYAASALYRRGKLKVGRTYRVRIALDEAEVKGQTFRRKLKTRTIVDATKALGC